MAFELVRLSLWRPVPATVIATQIRELSGWRRLTSYQPVITYSYEINGHKYASEAVHAITERGSHQWAVDITNRYPPGLATTAYASPIWPSNAFLIHKFSLDPPWLLILGVACLMYLWLYTRWLAGREATAIAAAVPMSAHL
jgi:hypothetical protein